MPAKLFSFFECQVLKGLTEQATNSVQIGAGAGLINNR